MTTTSRILISSLLLLVCQIGTAQAIPERPNQLDKEGRRTGDWTIPMDKNWDETSNPDSVAFYRLISYRKGKPVGKVEGRYATGERQSVGEAISDQPEFVFKGDWKWFHKNGQLMQTMGHKNGKREGVLYIYYDDGTLERTAHYKKGLLHGVDSVFYDSGKLQSVMPYSSGKEEGTSKFWNEEGALLSEINWSGGMKNGPAKNYHENGQLEAKAMFLNDSIDGRLVEFHPNGQVSVIAYFESGKITLADTLFRENGTFRSTSQYQNGKLHGLTTHYDQNGRDSMHIKFDKGIRQYEKGFYASGKLEYEVPYINGLVHGTLIRYYESGEIEQKESFVNDLLEGEVRDFHPDGSVQSIRVYEADTLQGKVVAYHQNGTILFNGSYLDGEQHGLIQTFHDNGRKNSAVMMNRGIPYDTLRQYDAKGTLIYEAFYPNGVETGYAEYYPNGRRQSNVAMRGPLRQGESLYYNEQGVLESRKQYRNDTLHGIQKTYYDNGQVRSEEPMRMGKLNGEYKEFHEDGQLKLTVMVKDDLREGDFITYFPNGQVENRYTFRSGVQQGPYIIYKSTGKIEERGQFSNNELDGKREVFYSEGSKRFVTNYKEGKRHGERIEYWRNGDLKKKEIFEDGELIKKWSYGRDGKETSTSLNDRAIAASNNGKIDEAIELGLMAVERSQKTRVVRNPNHWITLRNLADYYQIDDNFEESGKYYLEALQLAERYDSEDKERIVTYRNDLAWNYYLAADYKNSEKQFRQVLQEVPEVFGQRSVEYVSVLENMAYLYRVWVKLDSAENYFLNAIEILEQIEETPSSRYTSLKKGLAQTYDRQGLYPNAEALYSEVLRGEEAIFGKNDKHYAITLDNLAMVYLRQNQTDRAIPLLNEAVSILKEVTGEQSKDYAIILDNLASCYMEQDMPEKAKPLYEEANAIWVNHLGKRNQNYAISLNNLATIHVNNGQYDTAKVMIDQARQILDEVVGKNLSYAGMTYRLARLNENTIGGYWIVVKLEDKTDTIGYRIGPSHQLYLDAIDLYEELLGENHPAYATILSDFASYLSKRADFEEIIKYERKALLAYSRQIEQNFWNLSEREQERYFNSFKEKFESFYTFTVARLIDDQELTQDAYDIALKTKGLLFNNSLSLRKRVVEGDDPVLKEKYRQYLAQREKLNLFYNSPPEIMGNSTIDIQKEEELLNDLERELSIRSTNLSETNNGQSWKQIQKRLANDEAAVEVVRFRVNSASKNKTMTAGMRKFAKNATFIDFGSQSMTDSVVYMALVVKKESVRPQMVLLNEGKQMEGAFFDNYKFKLHSGLEDRKSYTHFWKPIADELEGVNKVYFSGDGIFHAMSLGSLLNPESGNYLVDELTIHMLPSTRDLLHPENQEAKNKSAYLLGGANFGGESVSRNRQQSSRIKPLPETIPEIEGIGEILSQAGISSNLFKENEATEENVKNWRSPGIAHIATHGFFQGDALGSGDSIAEGGTSPLFRSGLLLAGAADGSNGEGILTAYEAMNLDFFGTELVTLSACETGLGVIKNGEGVYGLQRAFLTAGAQSVLMSLWKVDDAITRELMQAFYRNWMLGDQSKREALKNAKLEIRQNYPAPENWAAFVLIGR